MNRTAKFEKRNESSDATTKLKASTSMAACSSATAAGARPGQKAIQVEKTNQCAAKRMT